MEKKNRILEKKVSLAALAVPVGVIIAAFLPLRPFVQQALVGITLIWFYLVINLEPIADYLNHP